MTLQFPPDYGTRACVLVPLNIALVPILAGQLAPLRAVERWASDADHQLGYNALAEVYICMLGTCTAGLQTSIDRLYRLLDHVATGAAYTWSEIDGVVVVDPPIPAVPDSLSATPDSLLGLLRALPGFLDAGWFGIGSRPATLADIVNALRSNAPDTTAERFQQAVSLLDEAADVASIGNFVTNILDEGTDIVGDAGTALMIALLGASQTAMGQQLAQRLDRLIVALDGGGAAPADSVLRALRGDSPANAERNVIDAVLAGSAGSVTPADIDRIIAELQQIKAAL
jgi:hypothetical protein